MVTPNHSDVFAKHVRAPELGTGEAEPVAEQVDVSNETIVGEVATVAGQVATQETLVDTKEQTQSPNMFGGMDLGEIATLIHESEETGEVAKRREADLFRRYKRHQELTAESIKLEAHISSKEREASESVRTIDNFLMAQGTDPANPEVALISMPADEYESLGEASVIRLTIEELRTYEGLQQAIRKLSSISLPDQATQEKLTQLESVATSFATNVRNQLIAKKANIPQELEAVLTTLNEKKAEVDKEIEGLMSDPEFSEHIEALAKKESESNSKKQIAFMKRTSKKASRTIGLALSTIAKKSGIEFSDDDPEAEDNSGLPVIIARLNAIQDADRERFVELVSQIRTNLAIEVTEGRVTRDNIRPLSLPKEIGNIQRILGTEREYIQAHPELTESIDEVKRTITNNALLIAIVGRPDDDKSKETNPFWVAVNEAESK